MSSTLVNASLVPDINSQSKPSDEVLPGGIIVPSQVLQIISQSNQAGCLVIADPRDYSINWKLYLNGGQINYVTSTSGQRERFTCLWQQFQNRLTIPSLHLQEIEYTELHDWWLTQKLSMANLQALFLQFSQEALAQILAFEPTFVKFFPNYQLEPTLVNYPWQEFIAQFQTAIGNWKQLRTEIASPFSRFYLDPQKMFDFYKTWQNLSQQPDAIKVFGSRHLSFWLQILSQKKCLYEIAAQINVNPLTLALQLQPLLKMGVIQVLPFRETENQPLQAIEQTFTSQALTNQTIEKGNVPTPSSSTSRERVSYLKQSSNLPQNHTHSKPLVACIDDSKTVQQQVKLTLEAAGYQVLPITDPASTLTLLVRQKPVLILLDINMPEINGYELCQMLHRSRKLREIPIIMLTGREGLVDRLRAKFVGATEYLTKPFDPNQLIEITQRLASV